MAFPAWMALLTTLSEARNRGTILGAVSTAQGLGVLIGILIGGHLDQRSHIAPFVAAPIMVTIGCVLALLFVREGRVAGSARSLSEK
jgi:MFS family permease